MGETHTQTPGGTTMADAASTITVSADGDQLVIDLDGHRARLDDAERRELALQLLGSPLSTGDPITIERRKDHDSPKPNAPRPYQRAETEYSAKRPRPMPKPAPPTLPMPAAIPPPNLQTRTYRGWLITPQRRGADRRERLRSRRDHRRLREPGDRPDQQHPWARVRVRARTAHRHPRR